MNEDIIKTNFKDRPFYFTSLPLPINSVEQAEAAITSIANSSASLRRSLEYLHQTKAYTELGQSKSWGKFLKQSIPDLSIRQANQLLKLNAIEKQLGLGKPIGIVPIEALKMLEKLNEADRADVWVCANQKLISGGSILYTLEQEITDRKPIGS